MKSLLTFSDSSNFIIWDNVWLPILYKLMFRETVHFHKICSVSESIPSSDWSWDFCITSFTTQRDGRTSSFKLFVFSKCGVIIEWLFWWCCNVMISYINYVSNNWMMCTNLTKLSFGIKRWIAKIAFKFSINICICVGFLVWSHIIAVSKPSTTNGTTIRFYLWLLNKMK